MTMNETDLTGGRQPRKNLTLLLLAVGFIGLLVIGTVVWLYFTPYLSLMGMRSAAENRDAKAFCSYIDFPVLKDNLKAELNAKVSAEMNKRGIGDNPLSGLARAMEPAISDNLVDVYISPDAIERAFKDYDINQPPSSSGVRAPTFANETLNPNFLSEEHGEVSSSYESLNEFAVSYKPKSGIGSRLIFDRRGLWGWKLVNIKLD